MYPGHPVRAAGADAVSLLYNPNGPCARATPHRDRFHAAKGSQSVTEKSPRSRLLFVRAFIGHDTASE